MRYQPHIRCNIAYTPWPSAYCPPLTSFYLSNITSFVRPVIPLSAEHGHEPSRSLSGLWVNPFSRWVVRLYCHNPYVSQLVNHLRTRTPMGDLVDGRSSSRSLAFYLYKPCFFCLPSAFCGVIKTCT